MGIVHWFEQGNYGAHTMRQTKATQIYRRTKNLRAIQLLLGHNKLKSAVRCLGIEVDDGLEIAWQTEVQTLARQGLFSSSTATLVWQFLKPARIRVRMIYASGSSQMNAQLTFFDHISPNLSIKGIDNPLIAL